MAKFFKKYSLVLLISVIAGLLLGFKTLDSSDQQNVLPTPTPTPTTGPISTPSPVPIPTLNLLPNLSDEEIEELRDEIGIDPNASDEENIQKILEWLELEDRN